MKAAIITTRRSLWREERLGADIMVFSVGQPMLGYRFDLIVADPSCYRVEDWPDRQVEYAREWWEQSVRCRLEPGGKIDPNPWSWT